MTVMQKFDSYGSSVPVEIVSVLKKLKTDLMALGNITSVVLFGSYSKGTYGKDSDIDVAVFVFDDREDRLHGIFREAQRCAMKYPFDIQILVFPAVMLEEPVGIVDEIVMFGLDLSSL